MTAGGSALAELRVLVGTTDLDRATAFYGELLALPVRERWDDDDGRAVLFGVGPAGVIEVIEDSPHHPARRAAGVSLAIEVDDVDAVHERLRSAGLAIREPLEDRPWGHRTFGIDDPDGLPLVFFSAIPETVAGSEDR
jgi:catechol 2,3-dioxygenase-like lactoylglutathione lyase family enzyme